MLFQNDFHIMRYMHVIFLLHVITQELLVYSYGSNTYVRP